MQIKKNFIKINDHKRHGSNACRATLEYLLDWIRLHIAVCIPDFRYFFFVSSLLLLLLMLPPLMPFLPDVDYK
jgi:hypothetical protein